jgi:hypothetical protein
MEIIQPLILPKTIYMKKMHRLLPVLLLASALLTKAQAQNVTPSPPGNHETSHEPEQITKFLKRNQNIYHVRWRSNSTIIITLNNGKRETFDLSNEEIKKTFLNKYGTPPPPPPPPPAAPAPPPPPATLAPPPPPPLQVEQLH